LSEANNEANNNNNKANDKEPGAELHAPGSLVNG
jgi:hypothetical protein